MSNVIILGTEYPLEVYEHGSAYYDGSFVIVGGYGAAINSSNSSTVQQFGALENIYL